VIFINIFFLSKSLSEWLLRNFFILREWEELWNYDECFFVLARKFFSRHRSMMEIFEMPCARWDTSKTIPTKHTQRHFQAASNDLVHYYSIDVVVDEREREKYAEIFFAIHTDNIEDDDVKTSFDLIRHMMWFYRLDGVMKIFLFFQIWVRLNFLMRVILS
jgi:hypothetical protein